MQEHLKRITVPLADGSRRELSLLTMEDLREPLERLAAIGEKVAAIAEFYDVLLSKGPKGLAEHIIRYAVSLPAGNYDSMLQVAEHLSPGILSELFRGYNRVTPEQVADHFPDVVAIVTPADACFVERSQAYVSEGVFFASGGLLLYSRMTNSTQFKHQPVPRNVDHILYWNFSRCPWLSVKEVPCSMLDKDAVPYQPPTYITGLHHLEDCVSLRLIDPSGRSRLKQVVGHYHFDTHADNKAFESAFRDWANSGEPDNAVELLRVPTNIPTKGMIVDNMFAGLTQVDRFFDQIFLDSCAGTNLFQRNPDRPPKTGISRMALVVGIGSKCHGDNPQTDLSGLVGWNSDWMLSSMRYAVTPAVAGWRILLSKDCYTRLSSSMRASLAAKGFTVVNAG